ncbi:hypothetical protein DH2020_009706 [Rehmannia glutinosa]|uniref:Uncharacterized protein n=1 Tax=Rehmannia glutinosa TaxID=99300 RepID=A0ABR0X722_REHGL
MMGFGPMGSGAGGNSSSSTSNLSALAPPFTVDRLNPKPNSSPSLHYSDPPYTAEPFSHGWQFTSPSAPIPESVFESTGITSVPLSDDYQYSASAAISPTSAHWSALSSVTKASASAFAYGGEVKPYYSPYVPPLVGEDSLLVGDEGSRYNVGPTSGPSVKSQTDYAPDLFDVDYENRWVGSLGFDDGKRAKRGELDGSFSFEKANLGGSHGYKNQLNQGGFGTEKNRNKPTKDPGVSYRKFNQLSGKEVHTGSSSIGQMEDKSCHEQNLGYFPYDSNKTHNLAFSTTYPESYHSDLSYDMHKNLTNTQNPCSPFEKCVKPVDRPLLEGNRLTSSTSVKESPLQSRETFDRKITATYGIHLPDINILGGFAMGCDNAQVVNSTESSSDFIDHHSTTVDSPCWKGAPSSQFSSFDIEAGNVNNVKKNTDEYYGFDHEKHQKFHSGVDSSRAFPEKVGETNKNTENECASKEQSLFGAGVGFEISDDPNTARQQSVLNNLTCGFDMKVSDTKHLLSEESAVTTLNDVSEGGAVAVHAAEKVLASPASQEDATERTMLPDPKLNVPTMIKAIHNLSELLLFHLSGDACSLEEENSENLKHVISNLHSCLNIKIVQVSNKPELNNLVGDTSEKLPESRGVGTMLGSPHTSNESSDSHIKLDYHQHMHQKERNFSFSGKKDEKSPIFSPLGDDLDITRDDNMTKAIKKVLEENFHLDEEMHSQSLLFKNLWLDAEAKLCSISYKARFDRMKIQMEQIKLKAPQENEDTAEMMSEVCVSRINQGFRAGGPQGA